MYSTKEEILRGFIAQAKELRTLETPLSKVAQYVGRPTSGLIYHYHSLDKLRDTAVRRCASARHYEPVVLGLAVARGKWLPPGLTERQRRDALISLL